ncbi:hypothetical protein ACTQ45_03665 [Fundicoccus sp. Sow4_D5]|uniref:hypothetical protein n=1 Tax=unclassified Fundicoccus TaxID=2761543 RepID=UPI003F8DAA4D
MDIWILVIALLVIAIILFVISMSGKDSSNVEEQLSEYTVQQSQELYTIKSRLSELEREQRQPSLSPTDDYDHTTEDATDFAEGDETYPEAVSDMTREEVIRLYSQGYTMHEIAHEVKLNPQVVQHVIDDYIENR